MATSRASGWRQDPSGRCVHCRRFTYGRAKTCRRRRCPGYAPLWAGDQRRKLFDNLTAYDGSVIVLAVTAPGATVLPWDEQHCRALGAHVHSGNLGCRVIPTVAVGWNRTASDRWRRLHRRVYQSVRRHGVKPTLLVRAFEKQHRGVLHVHPVLGVKTGADRHAAHLYARYLSELASQYGFGFSERKLASRSGKRVAGYLSSYFVAGKKRKVALQDSVTAPDMPRSIIHVSTELTQQTGVTMRELRFRRFIWFIARRTNCPLDEAREIATRAVAGTLDLTVDSFLPSPRCLAYVLGREPPPRVALACELSDVPCKAPVSLQPRQFSTEQPRGYLPGRCRRSALF